MVVVVVVETLIRCLRRELAVGVTGVVLVVVGGGVVGGSVVVGSSVVVVVGRGVVGGKVEGGGRDLSGCRLWP